MVGADPRSASPGMKNRYGMAVMRGWLIGEQLHMLRPHGAEHRCPGQHLGIPHFIQLLRAEVDKRVAVAVLEFMDAPAIEIVGWLVILPGTGIMRHTAAREHRYTLGRDATISAMAFPSAAQRRALGKGGK